jgi:putative copper export protein
MLQFWLTDGMRSVHIVAGAVWLGGSVVYLLVIVPALRLSKAEPVVASAMGDLFRRVVGVCMVALLLSGVFLIVDRLSSTSVGTAYVIVLVVKIAVSLAMMVLAVLQAQEARRRISRRSRLWYLAPRWILGLGIVAFLLGATLTGLFEVSIAR